MIAFASRCPQLARGLSCPKISTNINGSRAPLSPCRLMASAPAVQVAAASAAGMDHSTARSTVSGASAKEDVTVQYVILRRDLWAELEWPLGSVVAQACHAATAALWLNRDDATAQAYCAPDNIDHMHKVVLEVKGEEQLHNTSGKLSEAGVRHKLWVEQPEGFPTCIATAPYPKSAVAPLLKKLKLCKWS